MFDDIIVGFKAVGFEGELKVVDLPTETLKAALIYGLRRMMQDNCNSAAKNLRDEQGVEELSEEDRRTIYDNRLQQLMSGETGTTRTASAGNGLSVEHNRVLTEYRAKLIKDAGLDPKAYKAADAKTRTKMIADWMIAETAKHDRWTKVGAELIKADEARKAAIADLDI